MKTSSTAKRLKQHMLENNLKQVDILRLVQPYCEQYDIKMNKSDISQYIAGKAKPNQDKLFVLARALNVTESWLMGFDETSSPNSKEIMSRNICYYMEIHNKTRQDMCDALGVKYTTFTDWVKGNSYPRIDKIELMANYFGIQKSDLIENHSSALSSSEIPDVKSTLDSIMEHLNSYASRPVTYDGKELSPEVAKLFHDEIALVLKRLRYINKYNNNKE